MKIPAYKYPLLDFDTRSKSFNEELFRATLYTKLMTSKHQGDRDYFKEYRQFIDDIANTKHIRTYLIAETITKYLTDNAEPIMTKLWNFIPDMKDQLGIILWRDWCYFYKKFDDEGQAVIMYFIAQGGGGEVGCVIKERDDIVHVRGNPPEESPAKAVAFTLSTLFLPFLEFAETETKIVNAKTGHRTKIGNEKYVTDIPLDIEIVDSTWFTTIIRSEGFGVSGHFRLQPVGQGRLGRKLTWIADFQKHGYTRRSHVEIVKTAEEPIDK